MRQRHASACAGARLPRRDYAFVFLGRDPASCIRFTRHAEGPRRKSQQKPRSAGRKAKKSQGGKPRKAKSDRAKKPSEAKESQRKPRVSRFCFRLRVRPRLVVAFAGQALDVRKCVALLTKVYAQTGGAGRGRGPSHAVDVGESRRKWMVRREGVSTAASSCARSWSRRAPI